MTCYSKVIKMINKTEYAGGDGALKRVGRRLRKAAAAIAAAGVLLSEGSLGAKAQEKPERPPVALKMGAAYDRKGQDFRALAIAGSKLPLPAGLNLEASLGFAGSLSTPGSFNVEEAKLSLSVPVAGPVWVDLYGYNSRHMAVQQFSVGADVGVGLPFGAAMVGLEHILDAGQRPLYGVLLLDAIKRLSLSVSGGYVTNCRAGSAGAGLRISLGNGLPALSAHSMAIFSTGALLFSDTRAMLEFEL